jgi:phosphosulfolactate synthase
MHEYAHAFPFLQIPQAPPKPRSSWMTVMSDSALAPGYLRDFLRLTEHLIDHAKLTDHANMIAGYSAALIQEKIAIYRQHGIPTSLGGIPFEVAAAQGKAEAYFKRAAALGFAAVEISEDVLPEPLSPPERDRCIQVATDLGLEVFTELGRKFPDKPLDSSEAIRMAERDLAAGSLHIVVENSDLIQAMNTGASLCADLIRALGKDVLIFEVGPGAWPGLAIWLIRTVGPDANFENVTADRVVPLDGMRRGLHREVGFTLSHPGVEAAPGDHRH